MTHIGSLELNTIYLKDCLKFAERLPDESVDLIITDPPYNVGKNYGDDVDDRLPEEEYNEWYYLICEESYRVMKNGYLYVSCTTNQLWTLRPLWERAGFSFQMMLMWHGPNYAGNSNTIRQQWRLLYEPIMMFLKGPRLSMLNDIKGYQTDAILRYTRPQSDFSGELKRVHVAQKPLGLYQAIIARTPGDVILDWFVGSGTVMMAAKSLGRKYIGSEVDPESFEKASKRIASVNPPLFTTNTKDVFYQSTFATT